jgi:hypothetical protein
MPVMERVDTALACLAVDRRLGGVLFIDLPAALLPDLGDWLGSMLTSPGEADIVNLGAIEDDDRLWWVPRPPGMDGTFGPGLAPGPLVDEPDGPPRLLLIPDLARASLAVTRAALTVIGADEAVTDRHGMHRAWQPRSRWIAACARSDLGSLSAHLLDRFAVRVDAGGLWPDRGDWDAIRSALSSGLEIAGIDGLAPMPSLTGLWWADPQLPRMTDGAIESVLATVTAQAGPRRDLALARLARALAWLDEADAVQEWHVADAAAVIQARPYPDDGPGPVGGYVPSPGTRRAGLRRRDLTRAGTEPTRSLSDIAVVPTVFEAMRFQAFRRDIVRRSGRRFVDWMPSRRRQTSRFTRGMILWGSDLRRYRYQSRPGPAARQPVARPVRQPPSPPSPGVSILHVPGPRFGRPAPEPGVPATAEELQARVWADVSRLMEAGAPRPDLLVVSGGLTQAGGLREFDEALAFLTGTCEALGLGPERCVIVPGSHDVTRRACQAYFADCEADDVDPVPPYWPKWRHFSRIFDEFYADVEGAAFDRAQPWTLFEVPGLRLVVAGLNSTMAESHRPQDRHGELGEAQVGWFAEHLRPYADNGWLRLAVVSHDPAALRDAPALDGPLGGRLNLVLHGQSEFSRTDTPDSPVPPGSPDPEVPTAAAGPAGQHEILHLTPDGRDALHVVHWRHGDHGQGA